jgi:hypothetical protein
VSTRPRAHRLASFLRLALIAEQPCVALIAETTVEVVEVAWVILLDERRSSCTCVLDMLCMVISAKLSGDRNTCKHQWHTLLQPAPCGWSAAEALSQYTASWDIRSGVV